jgi:hypothetical protein
MTPVSTRKTAAENEEQPAHVNRVSGVVVHHIFWYTCGRTTNTCEHVRCFRTFIWQIGDCPSSSFHRSTSLFLGCYWTSISTAKLTAPVVLFVGIAGCDGKYKAIQLCIFASEIATSFWQLCEPYLFALCRCQNAFRRIFTHNLILVRQQWHAISDQLLDLFIGVPGMPQHYWDSILFSWTGFRRWFYENYKWSLLFFLAKEFVCAIIIPIFFKFLIMQRDQ